MGSPDIAEVRREQRVSVQVYFHARKWSAKPTGGVTSHTVDMVVRPCPARSKHAYSFEGTFGLEELQELGPHTSNKIKQLVVKKVCKQLGIAVEELRGVRSWVRKL